MLENKGALNGFLSVPLRGKCIVCKSKIHHPKSLVLNGAFGDDEGRGPEHGDFGDKGKPAATATVGEGEDAAWPLPAREGDT